MEIVTENATSLAWIGDAVMSLAVREHLLSLGFRKAHVLQKKNAVICSAKGQAIMLNKKTILARGRNATIHSKAKNATHKTYLEATALESMLGYLYLYGHQERLKVCLDKIIEIGDSL